MTIDNLEVLAADLYKRAEEATPIVGGADRLDWMARKIDEFIENRDPALNDLLQYETMDEVEGYMDKLYEHRSKDETTLETKARVDSLEDREGIVTDRDDIVVDSDGRVTNREEMIVDPVGDVMGFHKGEHENDEDIAYRDRIVDDYHTKVKDTDETIKDYRKDISDRKDVVTPCSAEMQNRIDNMDRNRDRLEDDFVDERPQQPEYLGDDPNRFDPDLVIESETYIISDGVDERMREAIDNQDEHLTCKGK